jgi:hypothetical protein
MGQTSEGHLQTSLAAKGRRILTNICHWVDTNRSVKKLTLFLPGLALLQSPRTKYLVAWLAFIRFVRRVCHQWHTSATPLKTSQPCDVIQVDLQNCTSQVNIYSSTTLQLHHQIPLSFCWSESQGVKTSTTMAHHDPRMNRTDPQISCVRHHWYLRYPVWLLQLFVDCLACSGYCL